MTDRKDGGHLWIWAALLLLQVGVTTNTCRLDDHEARLKKIERERTR